eukprot:COSAG05_NODE_257_length_12748_cov_68.067120_1_plen_1550_part_10
MTHGATQVDGSHDPFWSVVHDGIVTAGSSLGVQVEHYAPTMTDVVQNGLTASMTALVNDAIAEAPDGIILSIPSNATVDAALTAIAAANIPVFSVNSGYNIVDQITFSKRPLLHIGQDEIAAGEQVALDIYTAGKRKAACVNDEPANEAKAARCTAFNAKFLTLSGATVLTSSDPHVQAFESAYSTNSGKQAAVVNLMQNADIDVIITLSASVAIQVHSFKQQVAFDVTSIGLATFDTHSPNDEINIMLDSNDLILAVDQQPFLQGFLPVLFMTTFTTSLMKAENTKLKTGPAMLTDSVTAAPYAAYDLADVVMKAETHGQGGDGFWDVVYLGSKQAAADVGVTLDLTDMCSPEFSLVGNSADADEAMAQYINAALALPVNSSTGASRPAGFLVSIPDATTLRPSLLAAHDAGVAVVSLNSGYESAGNLSALTHVGMTEFEAGKMAGEYFINRGHTQGLCANHEPTNSAIIQRCGGFLQAFVEKFPTDASQNGNGDWSSTRVVEVNIPVASGFDSNKATIVAQLQANANIDCVLIGGQSAKQTIVDAITQVGGTATIKAGTFDYSSDVGALISAGSLEFGIHQQQYYQGYVPVVLLTLYQTRGLKLLEPILFTGPAFVTAADVLPRQCELSPVCEVNAIANTDTVLRATFGTDTESIMFAPAGFGMSAANMSNIWSWDPVLATSITGSNGACAPLTSAVTPGTALIVDEGDCLFTTKARYAQQAGYGIVVIARTNGETPIPMTGIDASGDITVPVLLISQFDGDRIRTDASTVLRITPFALTCPMGTRELNFNCEQCTEGTYQDSVGATSCISCPAGTSSKTIGADSASSCLPCEAGSFQDLTGQMSCKFCSDSSYSSGQGATSCTTCPANNATGVLVVVSRTCGFDFQDGIISDKCDQNVPKTSTADCFCTEGYFGEPGQHCDECPTGASCCSCPDLYTHDGASTVFDLLEIYGNFDKYDRPCASCTYGATTSEVPPMPLPGFFAAVAKPNTFLHCEPAGACNGGPISECAEGYDSFRCGQCAPGFYRDAGECSTCPTTPQWLVVLACSLMMIFCLYTLNAVSRWFRSGALSIALDWAQTITIISSFSLEWPHNLRSLLSSISLVMFNTEYFAPECSFKSDYWGNWGLRLTLPFLITMLFLAIFFYLRTKHKYFGQKDTERPGWSQSHAAAVGNAFVNAFFMFLSVFHPFLAKTSLEIFRCRQLADGEYYMDVEPSKACYTDEWFAHMPFAVLAFVVYGVGIPLLFFVVLYGGYTRNELDTRMFKRRYGSIFIVYKKDAWYWELWIKTKKLLVCLAMNLFPEETTYQGILAFVVIEIAIHLNMKHQPFRYKANNRVQRAASLNTLAVLFSGLMFYSGKIEGAAEDALVCVVFAWVVCTGIWMIRAFGVEFIAFYGHWVLRNHPSWTGLLESGCGEWCFNSKTSLAASHWANTEELLDRYTKRMKAAQRTGNDENAHGLELVVDDGKSVKGGKQSDAVMPVSVGDIGQSLSPDPTLLFELFFREDALIVLEQWRATTDSDVEYKALTKILQSAKGAGELAHMQQEMAKME